MATWPPSPLVGRSGTFGGGGGRRGAEDVREHPLATQHRRGAIGIGRHGQQTGMPQDAAPARRLCLVETDAAEMRAVYSRDAVVPRQSLVDERVVGLQQFPHAAFSRNWLSTNNSVSFLNASRRFSSNSGNATGSGTMLARSRSRSHCPAKLSTRACARSSASMRRTCSARTRGDFSVPRSARSSNGSSGMLLQRKNDNRDASSTSLSAYGVPGAQPGRVALHPEQEVRGDEQALERRLDAGVEASLRRVRAPLRVERHQRRDIAWLDRPPIGAPCQRAQNPLGARDRPREARAGRQLKMRRRLGVSPGPVTA